jgi:UDP-N-acetylmuramate: L-alanyl-gamma-D-glutamyl-meso-diaminopimelate ligase
MHLHILGICGTFMGGIAALAKADGHIVTGCDANVYPPMSTQLESLGIALTEGYDAVQLERIRADVFVIGNVITRGNPLMEAILNRGLPYISGPDWLARNFLAGKWVLAVAGTHGKTTTSSMLARILDFAGYDPGFLIGGVPEDFGVSARRTASNFFVIEADEYDTAFFDKRSKFVHYHPRTAVLNNLEFDHADIFPDLAAIEDAVPSPGPHDPRRRSGHRQCRRGEPRSRAQARRMDAGRALQCRRRLDDRRRGSRRLRGRGARHAHLVAVRPP